MELADVRKSVRAVARTHSNVAQELDRYARLGTSAGATLEKQEILGHLKSLLPQLSEDVRSRLQPWVDAENEMIARAMLDLGHRLALELEGELSKNGLTLTGQLPHLRAGPLTIEVDQSKNTATLLLGPETVRRGIRLEPGAVAGAVRSFVSELDSSPFEPETFLRQLKEAYDQLLCEGKRRAAAKQVPLPEVCIRMALLRQGQRFRRNPVRETFVSYPRWQFSHDLFRLRESGRRQIDGLDYRLITATMDAAKSPDRYVWVPDDRQGNGTRYSFLTFGGRDGA